MRIEFCLIIGPFELLGKNVHLGAFHGLLDSSTLIFIALCGKH